MTTAETRRRALALAPKLAGFGATAIAFLRRGGEAPARLIAEQLDLPLFPLDVRYPLSRLIERAPPAARPLLFLCKEAAYRLGSPVPAPGAVLAVPRPGPGERLLLVDDSASSGRTLAGALRLLAGRGWTRDRVRVAVLRCGPRARALVDVDGGG
jgi:hypoxanthine phosphoribosyltransferase